MIALNCLYYILFIYPIIAKQQHYICRKKAIFPHNLGKIAFSVVLFYEKLYIRFVIKKLHNFLAYINLHARCFPALQKYLPESYQPAV